MAMRRWVVVSAAALVYTALMFAVGTVAAYVLVEPAGGWEEARHLIAAPHQALGDWFWWQLVGFPIVLLVATQFAFLLPHIRPRPPAGNRSKSMRVSVAALAVVPAMLTVALAAAVFGAIDLIRGDVHPVPMGPFARVMLLGVLPVMWAVWTAAFLALMRRSKRYGVSRRALGLLVGGTMAELVLFLPLDAMVRRQTDCYCETRSYLAMCLSLWSLLWLTGPGILLLLTRRHRHRLWSGRYCHRCGFEKGPTPGDNCPECGSRWT